MVRKLYNSILFWVIVLCPKESGAGTIATCVLKKITENPAALGKKPVQILEPEGIRIRSGKIYLHD